MGEKVFSLALASGMRSVVEACNELVRSYPVQMVPRH